MPRNYTALEGFILHEMIQPGLEINPLKTTHSAIRAITSGFARQDWNIEVLPKLTGKHSQHRLASPNGQLVLKMIGGKVFRHPAHTEQICRSKNLTKKFLGLAGLPIPEGADFGPKEREVAKAYFGLMLKPVVVKPAGAGGSHGVTVGVTENEQFNSAWDYALSEGRNNSNVILEQFIPGFELRPYVIGDKVVSVVARIQPFVIGDGKTSLENLIVELHEVRRVNYRAMKLPVVVDWAFVSKQGAAFNAAPAEGEIIFLNPFCYPTIGASIVDVTDRVCDGIKDLALRAKNAVPGLEIAGIDILTEDLSTTHTANVVEVNTAAALDMHRYPTHGTPREIVDDIVSYFTSRV